MNNNNYINPGLAAVLSAVIPGLGQILCQKIGRGFTFMGLAALGYMLAVIPGILVAIFACVDALNCAKEYNSQFEELKK